MTLHFVLCMNSGINIFGFSNYNDVCSFCFPGDIACRLCSARHKVQSKYLEQVKVWSNMYMYCTLYLVIFLLTIFCFRKKCTCKNVNVHDYIFKTKVAYCKLSYRQYTI